MKQKELYRVTYDTSNNFVAERRTIRTMASSMAQAISNARYREGIYKNISIINVEKETGKDAVEQ